MLEGLRNVLNTVTPVAIQAAEDTGYGWFAYVAGGAAVATTLGLGSVAYKKDYLHVPSKATVGSYIPSLSTVASYMPSFGRKAAPAAFVAPTLAEVRDAMKSDAVRNAFDNRSAQTQAQIVALFATEATFAAFQAKDEAGQLKAVSPKPKLKAV